MYAAACLRVAPILGSKCFAAAEAPGRSGGPLWLEKTYQKHVDMSFNSWCLLYMLFLVCACAVTPCSFLMLHCSRGAKQAISTPQVRAFRSLVQACTSYDCWWLLYLLSTPTSIRISHVRRRFNGWHEFEGDVCDSGEDDKGAVQVLPPLVAHDDTSQEDIDCVAIVRFQRSVC